LWMRLDRLARPRESHFAVGRVENRQQEVRSYGTEGGYLVFWCTLDGLLELGG
jgi:hypothetical protein